MYAPMRRRPRRPRRPTRQSRGTAVHLIDHDNLTPPTMACPFRSNPDGTTAPCMGEPCALWYRSTDPDYCGCSLFVAAFYACNVSYNTRSYYRRE